MKILSLYDENSVLMLLLLLLLLLDEISLIT